MTAVDGDHFSDRLVSQTSTYLDRVTGCVEETPALVEQYAEDGAYARTADRIADLESECDRIHREVSSLVAAAGAADLDIRLTRLHLNSRETVRVYHLLDEVANAVEQFAADLVALAPARDRDCLDLLAEMAASAAAAMPHLRVAVGEYVRLLCDAEASRTVADEVARVRAAESACDDTRNALVRTAFDDGPPRPLLYRDLALRLDAVADTMEDVTDHLVVVAGTRPWIEVEPDDGRPA